MCSEGHRAAGLLGKDRNSILTHLKKRGSEERVSKIRRDRLTNNEGFLVSSILFTALIFIILFVIIDEFEYNPDPINHVIYSEGLNISNTIVFMPVISNLYKAGIYLNILNTVRLCLINMVIRLQPVTDIQRHTYTSHQVNLLFEHLTTTC